MMNSNQQNLDLERREFLRLSALLPFALALGCSEDASVAEVEAALRKFILAVGPWPEAERDAADDFATRFLVAGGISSVFLEQAETVEKIARREPFAKDSMQVEEVDLSGYDPAERQLLMDLVQRIYGILEVQYVYLRGEPDIGECPGREMYQRAPKEWEGAYRKPD